MKYLVCPKVKGAGFCYSSPCTCHSDWGGGHCSCHSASEGHSNIATA